MSWLEGLRERRQPAVIAAAAVLALVVLAGLTAWYALRHVPTPLFGSGGGTTAAAGGAARDGGDGAVGGTTAGGETAPPPAMVLVHVAGAVVTPGVYSLQEGQRVVDAVRVAGGAKPDAAIDSINLAQPVADGQRLYVPTRKEIAGTPTGGVYSGGKPFTPPGGSGAGGGGSGPLVVNPNTATLAELDAIPGIGPVLAERIIVWRTANGPFKTVDELTNVSGIGEKTLADLKPYLTLK